MPGAEEIDQLRSLRGIPKGMVTKLINWVSENGDLATLFDIEVRLDQLKKYEEQFEKVQTQLEALDPAERSPDAVERSTFEDRVAVLKARLLQLKSSHHDATFDTTMGAINVDVVNNELPHFDIPKFDGDYRSYPHFIDSFNVLVHNSHARGMTEMRKFAILKSSLTGRALEAIRDLPMTNETYAEALSILKERFENKRLIFESYVKDLWEQPKAHDTTSLRKLCDSFVSGLRGLERLSTPADVAAGILIHLILSKCDRDTIRKWEEQSATKMNLCTQDEFLQFLKNRCVQLENVEYALKSSQQPSVNRPRQTHTNTVSTSEVECPLCTEHHFLTKCKEFVDMTPNERYNIAKDNSICIRCLEDSRRHNCRGNCSKCRKPHHTLLHFEKKSRPNQGDQTTTDTPSNDMPSQQAGSSNTLTSSVSSMSVKPLNATCISGIEMSLEHYTFLATALVLVRTVDGNYVTMRVLFDGGSQTHLITERATKVLGLPRQKLDSPMVLHGINSSETLTHVVVAKLKSVHNDLDDELALVVHKRMRQRHPTHKIEVTNWEIPSDKLLADQNFNIPQEVDIILNANETYKYLLPGQISLGSGKPLLQNTVFGWIVVGNVNGNSNNPLSTNMITNSISANPSHKNLETLIKQFWEVETIQGKKLSSPEELECEEHFKKTYARNADGRFVLRLPFKKSPLLLGKSRNIVKRRLQSIVKKIEANPEYGRQYEDFMQEYIDLGHCSRVDSPSDDGPHYYIPHFAVENPDSTTTKLRVVFDCSCKTDNGVCLNDLLMVGPTIQKDLIGHLLYFRSQPIALTGDLTKMYRNIDIDPRDRHFQLILWPKNDEIVTYRLNTVTYGTASAPFGAIRCLTELANIDGADVPVGATTLKENFYVDDLLSGAQTVKEVIEKHNQLQQLLKRGQLTLRKIQSNSPEVMQSIPDEIKGTFVTIGNKEVIKTLGLNWIPESDTFVYYYEPSKNANINKRAVLSETARLFDPLGLLQPVIVKAKIFMQWLWSRNFDWDEPLPPAENELWVKFREELTHIGHITVPRFVCFPTYESLQLHIFGDASDQAYGSCAYVRTVTVDGRCKIELLKSKSRVAPLKKLVISRLELLAGLLSAQMWEIIQENFPITPDKIVFWTDSTIALKWIKGQPHKWNNWVSNRVIKIQDLTNISDWRYVPGELNPADIVSRGLWPTELHDNQWWFHGPDFLQRQEDQWPVSPPLPSEVPETRNQTMSLYCAADMDVIEQCKYSRLAPILKFLVWPKLKRVFAYVGRFISRLKQKWRSTHHLTLVSNNVESLSVEDIVVGVTTVVKIVQYKCFNDELKVLSKGKPLLKQSKVRNLSPFIDTRGLLRVGGRLRNAPQLTFDEKCPLLLPYNHPVSEFIMAWAHTHNLHATQTSLLAFVRQRFWPVRGRNLANKIVRQCLKCSRVQPTPFNQFMADLPSDRVSETDRGFLVTAVDFAGPFTVHHKGRGSRTTKVYLAVFVCFSSRAVHLELVESLTTDAFLDTLRRFISRRGVPHKILSDNGTNFVGANNKLKELYEVLLSVEAKDEIHQFCRDTFGIKWVFIPPRTPHFGGLHEAAVKSAKLHMMKVIGSSTLTLFELLTVVAMVESILNSRPLSPLSINPDDGQPLTPGHLLIGSALNELPEPTINDFEPDYIKRWSKTVAVKQAFWRKWSREYLQSLQLRSKWQSKHPNVKVDDLVLIVDQNSSSLKWTMGRITRIIPSKDGIVRVVDVTTKQGTYQRGISQLCPIMKDAGESN